MTIRDTKHTMFFKKPETPDKREILDNVEKHYAVGDLLIHNYYKYESVTHAKSGKAGEWLSDRYIVIGYAQHCNTCCKNESKKPCSKSLILYNAKHHEILGSSDSYDGLCTRWVIEECELYKTKQEEEKK